MSMNCTTVKIYIFWKLMLCGLLKSGSIEKKFMDMELWKFKTKFLKYFVKYLFNKMIITFVGYLYTLSSILMKNDPKFFSNNCFITKPPCWLGFWRFVCCTVTGTVMYKIHTYAVCMAWILTYIEYWCIALFEVK